MRTPEVNHSRLNRDQPRQSEFPLSHLAARKVASAFMVGQPCARTEEQEQFLAVRGTDLLPQNALV